LCTFPSRRVSLDCLQHTLGTDRQSGCTVIATGDVIVGVKILLSLNLGRVHDEPHSGQEKHPQRWYQSPHVALRSITFCSPQNRSRSHQRRHRRQRRASLPTNSHQAQQSPSSSTTMRGKEGGALKKGEQRATRQPTVASQNVLQTGSHVKGVQLQEKKVLDPLKKTKGGSGGHPGFEDCKWFTPASHFRLATPWGPLPHRTALAGLPADCGSHPPESPRSVRTHPRRSGD